MLFDQASSVAADGRGMNEGRVYDQAGSLIMSAAPAFHACDECRINSCSSASGSAWRYDRDATLKLIEQTTELQQHASISIDFEFPFL